MIARPQSIRTYCRHTLHADLLAGLTVAVMGVPQAMAYAMIAELPPVFGLYTAMVSCAVAALFGSSSHLVTGPTNAVCMLLLALVGPIARDGGYDPVEVVLLLTLLTGVIQLAFGFLRLGGIIRYVSNSVVVGFTVGAGILIGANQLKNILGINLAEHGARRFHEVIFATLRELPHSNLYALAIGGVTIAVTLILTRVDRRIPAGLIGVIVAGLVAVVSGWGDTSMGIHRVQSLRDIQVISGNLLAMFRMPKFVANFDPILVKDLLAGATALALIGFLEAASIARTIAAKSGQRLDFNQEFIGQGMSKISGAFCSCFASSGSFTRSLICYQTGGKTRMASVFSAIWTALIVVLLGPLANHIPKPALAGLLLVVAGSMIDRRRLRITWRSGMSSRIALGGTLLATLVLPLQYAIFVGVLISIVNLLRVTGRMHLTQLIPHPDQGFEEIPFTRAPASPVVAINLEGALYFAAADDLDYELLRCLHPVTRVVVLRMKRLRAAGSTAMAMLEHYEELLRSRGIQLVVCGVEEELARLLTGSGLRARIGERNIFYADNRLLRSTELAHARAWSIVAAERSARSATSASLVINEPRRVVSGPTVGEMMSRQCIRFGNRHPLREALWLMSEMKKESTSPAPLPLFLQDRFGRVFGELSVWRILAGATEGEGDLSTLDPDALRERMRARFEVPIDSLADTDLPRLDADATVGDALRRAVGIDLSVLPVRDANDRLVGILDPVDLLRGVAKALGLPTDQSAEDQEDAGVWIASTAPITAAIARVLLRPSDAAPRTLIVTDEEESYRGIVTPAGVVRGIAEVVGDGDLTAARDEVFALTIADVMSTDAPTVPASAPLSRLLDVLVRHTIEAVPIVEGARAVGLITIVDVFRSAADLALNPEDRGIDVTRKD